MIRLIQLFAVSGLAYRFRTALRTGLVHALTRTTGTWVGTPESGRR